ncbi:TetR/AcrR family transcriptional regulator [Aestuariivita sp.]|jgi:TetR/AcrR family transcriptional repressor of lmrAB and yxaGH operons|uniref:TetR/AcrR family transcriptional regulator n=1 Tax=Aestuariivita sp. TaxID=1872407 RepID=UPI00217208C3|nr:TetR/AcrR family transcriptional regulator [Aestuariivita sp.]MCE8006505.1 TetR/AcrR family transcriptional regulator [Aestuariivita sp.]
MSRSDTPPLPTKDRLIRSAAHLFRRHGYNGVGLNDLLDQASAPKGSLYHHFPNGKSDLAIAAATWASDEMLRLMAASFSPADSFEAGLTTLCHKLAKLFDLSGMADGCPVSGALFDGPNNDLFRNTADHIFEGWITEAEHVARGFGAPPDQARRDAELFFMLLQGGWTLARARGSSDVLRELPNQFSRS